MRRKDRELTAQEGLAIIDACEYGTISCVDEAGEIFSVPISVVREGESVFLHGAPAGSKAKLLKDGKSVTLVCVSYARVPVLTDEQLDAIKDDGKALGAKVFTTEYKSAVAITKAYVVTDEAARLHALRLLSKKYTPNYMRTFDVAAAHGLKAMNIYELKIASVTAKAKIIRN